MSRTASILVTVLGNTQVRRLKSVSFQSFISAYLMRLLWHNLYLGKMSNEVDLSTDSGAAVETPSDFGRLVYTATAAIAQPCSSLSLSFERLLFYALTGIIKNISCGTKNSIGPRGGYDHLRTFQSADYLKVGSHRFLQGTRHDDGRCGLGSAITLSGFE